MIDLQNVSVKINIRYTFIVDFAENINSFCSAKVTYSFTARIISVFVVCHIDFNGTLLVTAWLALNILT